MINATGLLLDPSVFAPGQFDFLQITPTGDVLMLIGTDPPVNIGNVTLTTFINPEGLEEAPGYPGYFFPTAGPDGSGAPNTGTPGTDGRGTLIPGN